MQLTGFEPMPSCIKRCVQKTKLQMQLMIAHICVKVCELWNSNAISENTNKVLVRARFQPDTFVICIWITLNTVYSLKRLWMDFSVYWRVKKYWNYQNSRFLHTVGKNVLRVIMKLLQVFAGCKVKIFPPFPQTGGYCGGPWSPILPIW